MTRLIARLILAMLLLPFSGCVFVLAIVMITAGGGPPTILQVLLMWLVLYTFIAAYWLLLWRDVVKWTRDRVRRTGIRAPAAVTVGAIGGSFVGRTMQLPFEVALLVGGGLVPIFWVLATVLIWRETPQERIERLTLAGTDTVACPMCGFNLTGLHNARCPECGRQFTLDQLMKAQRDGEGVNVGQ